MKISKDVKDEIKMYQANDYEIDSETPAYVLMKKNTQSIAVHFILALCFWWICFIPNIIYYFMSNKSRKIMK